MTDTQFRASKHSWPFGNSWAYTVPYMHVDLHLGFCGGMCWTALKRFYDRIPIDTSAPTPKQGDALYNEILSAQEDSLPVARIAKIFNWQNSPDLPRAGLYHSLVSATRGEWPKVQDHLDHYGPVTLTLIASSNDFNPANL